MSSSPRLRVIGLVTGLAVLALVAGFLVMSRGQSSSSAATTHTVVPLSKRARVKKHAAKAPFRKAVTKTAASKPAESANGLPAALEAALTRNRVVVVSLYAPKVEIDEMAMREARAGAAAAGVGFVALNVLTESQARPLTKQLGVLEDPAVLVFRRPNVLVVRFSGFADMQTVAQAARNTGL